MAAIRVIQKHDIEANWLKAVNFSPKEGEIIIYDAEVESSVIPEGRTERITYPRAKVGDGTSNVNDLPFITDYVLDIVSKVQSFYVSDDNAGAVTFYSTSSGN